MFKGNPASASGGQPVTVSRTVYQMRPDVAEGADTQVKFLPGRWPHALVTINSILIVSLMQDLSNASLCR